MKTLMFVFTILAASSILVSGCGATAVSPTEIQPTLVSTPTLPATASPTPEVVQRIGTVTIATKISFSVWPRAGKFSVLEGADILGCSAGSFVDTPVDPKVQKLLTCESGTRTGTFTVEFSAEEAPRPGDENGPWNIFAATGDFVGLTGKGDFWVVVDEAREAGFETFTGAIEYGP